MKIKPIIIKQWLGVTFGSTILLGSSFLVYFMLVMIFERLGNLDGQYGFMSKLRVGYGVFVMILCSCLYFTKLLDWIKACFLTVSYRTMDTLANASVWTGSSESTIARPYLWDGNNEIPLSGPYIWTGSNEQPLA